MVTQSSGKRVPVVQAYAYTKYLGYLELDFDSNWKIVNYYGLPVLLDANFPEGIQHSFISISVIVHYIDSVNVSPQLRMEF